MINFDKSYSFSVIIQARAEILYCMAIEAFLHNELRHGHFCENHCIDAPAFAYDQINSFDGEQEITEWFNRATCGLYVMDTHIDNTSGEISICFIER